MRSALVVTNLAFAIVVCLNIKTSSMFTVAVVSNHWLTPSGVLERYKQSSALYRLLQPIWYKRKVGVLQALVNANYSLLHAPTCVQHSDEPEMF